MELEECFMVSISLPPPSAELAVSIIDGEESALCCIQDDDRECLLGLPVQYSLERKNSYLLNTGRIVWGVGHAILLDNAVIIHRPTKWTSGKHFVVMICIGVGR